MPRWQRILLKLSGEALAGDRGVGLDPERILQITTDMMEAAEADVEMAVVVGAGNIFRGEMGFGEGFDRVTGDHMGMLATVLNCLALGDVIRRQNGSARVMSAIFMEQVCDSYVIERAEHHLERGRITLLGAGTGNPYFSTDTAAALRAAELKCDVVLKATKVDGVYDRDPVADPGAVRYRRICYDDVLTKRLRVMDATAVTLCRENRIPILVFNLNRAGNIRRAVLGGDVGTLVSDAATATEHET